MSAGKKVERIKLGNTLLRGYAKEDLQQNVAASAVDVTHMTHPTGENKDAPVILKTPSEGKRFGNIAGMSNYHVELHLTKMAEADVVERETRERVQQYNDRKHRHHQQQWSQPAYQQPHHPVYLSTPPVQFAAPSGYDYSPQYMYSSPRPTTSPVLVMANPPPYYMSAHSHQYIPQYAHPQYSPQFSPQFSPQYSHVPYHIMQLSDSTHYQSGIPVAHLPGHSPPFAIQMSPRYPTRVPPVAEIPHFIPPHERLIRTTMSNDVKLHHGDIHLPEERVAQNSSKASRRTKSRKPKMQLGNINGKVLELSRGREQSRALQNLVESDPEMADLVYMELFPYLDETMEQEFGNYLFQKLYKVSSNERQIEILKAVQDSIHKSCMSKYGSRAVQVIIADCAENGKIMQSQIIVDALLAGAFALCMNENGNHVIQHCILKFPPEQTGDMFRTVLENCVEICKDKYGNRVIQSCTSSATNFRYAIVDVVVRSLEDLIVVIDNSSLCLSGNYCEQDGFGNYVIQHILETCPDHVDHICRAVVGNLTNYSMQKHASMVMEKCFLRGI